MFRAVVFDCRDLSFFNLNGIIGAVDNSSAAKALSDSRVALFVSWLNEWAVPPSPDLGPDTLLSTLYLDSLDVAAIGVHLRSEAAALKLDRCKIPGSWELLEFLRQPITIREWCHRLIELYGEDV